MSSLSKNFNDLSSSLKEEVMVGKKQGIVSILGSDCERIKSLRRTVSADMSSKKWLSQNGFSSRLKKIASSQEFPVSIIADSSSSEGEDEYEKETETRGRCEIWTSIQEEKEKKEPGQFDIWSSILTQKAQEETKNLPPYVHPLVKRAASSLSEKSLEICTESLGSETGSDGFSSYSASETGDAEEDKEEEEEQEEEERVAQNYDVEDWRIAKYNLAATTKKSPQKPFPPPLPSLSRRDDRASLHMRPRRDNGRLVLEAVSISSQNNFKAQRQDGRLVLSFINGPNQEEGIRREEENEMGMSEEEIENFEDAEEAEDGGIETEEEEEVDERGAGGGGGGGEEVRFGMEQIPKLASGVINVHRLALMMNKPMVLANRNPTWSNKFNPMAKFEEDMGEVVNPITPMAQSLPPVARMIPMPPTTKAAATSAKAATSFNAYEYSWKPKPIATTTAASCLSPITQKPMVNERRQELRILRGNKGDCLVHVSKGCKEPRRSLLFWEPYCIATS